MLPNLEGKEKSIQRGQGRGKRCIFPSSLFISILLSSYSNNAFVLILSPKAMAPHYLAKVYLFPATHKTS